MVPKKNSVISQKCQHIDSKEIGPIQLNRCKYKSATVINKILLIIPNKKILYMFLKVPINQIPLLGKLFSSFVSDQSWLENRKKFRRTDNKLPDYTDP